MEVVIISNDVNTNTQPNYMQRAIKYDLFDIYHLTNNIMCEVSMKMEGCFDDSDTVLNATNIPASYNTSMSVNYDMHYIGDQDGNFDETCTRAFIKKINSREQFSYLQCMEDNIDFANFMTELTYAIDNAVDAPLILDTIRTVTDGFMANSALITNEKNYVTMDISSGALNNSKILTHEVFQFQSIPLSGGQQFLESYEIDAKKSGNGLSIQLKAKILTLEVILDKLPGNAESVPLAAVCS